LGGSRTPKDVNLLKEGVQGEGGGKALPQYGFRTLLDGRPWPPRGGRRITLPSRRAERFSLLEGQEKKGNSSFEGKKESNPCRGDAYLSRGRGPPTQLGAKFSGGGGETAKKVLSIHTVEWST